MQYFTIYGITEYVTATLCTKYMYQLWFIAQIPILSVQACSARIRLCYSNLFIPQVSFALEIWMPRIFNKCIDKGALLEFKKKKSDCRVLIKISPLNIFQKMPSLNRCYHKKRQF